MKILILSAAVMTSLAAPAAWAQNAAYRTPNNNVTRSDDVDPSEAPYLNEEYGMPSDDESADYSASVNGAGSGESGLGEDDDDGPPGAPVPED